MESTNVSAPNPMASGDDQSVSLPPVMPAGVASDPLASPAPLPADPVGLPVDPLAQVVPPTSSDEIAAGGAASATPQTGKNSQFAPEIAEDVDLIEKEWVSKAKAIVNKTQGNPNEQSKEMSKFKADYLKTRFSKDLKVSDQ